MSSSIPTIRIYYLPQSFPCGVGSSCCGPIGQSQEEIQGYIAAIRKEVGPVPVETIDVTGDLDPQRDAAALRLLDSFGPMAVPIFAIDGEVVSMGPPVVEELVALVKTKISPTATT